MPCVTNWILNFSLLRVCRWPPNISCCVCLYEWLSTRVPNSCSSCLHSSLGTWKEDNRSRKPWHLNATLCVQLSAFPGVSKLNTERQLLSSDSWGREEHTTVSSYETARVFLLPNAQNWGQKWVLPLPSSSTGFGEIVKYRIFNSIKLCILL